MYEGVRHKADHNKNSDAAKKMGLRFDLTVPLARYVATCHGPLSFFVSALPYWSGLAWGNGLGKVDIDNSISATLMR
jgi:uncharacterized membrane protein YcfT